MVKQIIGVVGSRNTGKTTTTSNLTNIFVENGYKVVIIKFMHHKFDLDPDHKDSVVLRNSKAITFISSSPYETVVFQRTNHQTELASLYQYIPDTTDIVLCESYPSKFKIIPLIFICRELKDYFETKDRYNNQKPLFIAGIISNTGIKEIEGFPVLSNLQKAIELVLKARKSNFL